MNIAQKRILIIEDDQHLAEIYKTKLDLRGHDTVHAADGEQAVELFFEQKPDLVLLDIYLPKLDGFGVLHQMKKHEDFEETPIIVFSNLHIDLGDEEKERLGIKEFFLKSDIALEDMVESIERHL